MMRLQPLLLLGILAVIVVIAAMLLGVSTIQDSLTQSTDMIVETER
jgi:hypothetical protein